MKHSLAIAVCSIGALTIFAQACASTESEQNAPAPTPPTILDAGSVDADRPDRTSPQFPEPETCSAAGWCVVPAPADGNYVFQFEAVWPLTDHAFAAGRGLASDQSALPPTVQDWDYRTKTWTRIDADTAQTGPVSITDLWAPNADEVYYSTAQFGVRGAEIHHGRRPSPPEKAWSWSTQTVDCNVRFRPALWGSGPDDVRAVGCKKIVRHSTDAGDGGADSWVEELVETDASIELVGITGTGPDDVWIYGMKTNCPYVLRKTDEGFAAIAEGVRTDEACTAVGDRLALEGYEYGGTPPMFAPKRGELVILRNDGQQVAHIHQDSNGVYGVEFASPLPAVPRLGLVQVWGDRDGSLWLLTSDASILHATDVWSETGAKLEYSTLVRNGAPNDALLTTLRGTSTDNLWAAGAARAFHKSTP